MKLDNRHGEATLQKLMLISTTPVGIIGDGIIGDGMDGTAQDGGLDGDGTPDGDGTDGMAQDGDGMLDGEDFMVPDGVSDGVTLIGIVVFTEDTIADIMEEVVIMPIIEVPETHMHILQEVAVHITQDQEALQPITAEADKDIQIVEE